MRKEMIFLVVAICCGALMSGGCAKKELIKGEETNQAATKPVDTSLADQAAKDAAARDRQKDAAAASSSVKEEPLQALPSQADAANSLDKIYFDFDSYVLSQPARDTLNKMADRLLKKGQQVKMQVEGHCDERGSDEYNLALGEKRAKAALNYLVTLGASAARLSFISYGKEKPADPGHDDAAWAKNRRAEFIIGK